MNNIDIHKQLYSLVTSSSNCEINSAYIQFDKNTEVSDGLKNLGFEIENLHDKDRVVLSNINLKIFSSRKEFWGSFKDTFNNVLIFNDKLPISYINNNTYENFELVNDNYLFSNSISYLKFLRKLKELENDIDASFNFIDSYNRDSRKIIFVSLAEKSRLIICHENTIPHFDEKINYSTGYDNFIECFSNENKNLPRFLKSSIINTISHYDPKNRMQQFFETLDSIILKAKLNFEVYLNELSLDKIKKEYDDIKTKYFNNLSEVLSKLTNNILALPVAIAALLFSIEKIKEYPIYLYLLAVILIITSLYLSLLLKVYFSDLTHTKSVFKRDYSFLIENNFFNKYPDEKVIFEDIKSRIIERINFLKLITQSYFWVMNLSNIVIVDFILFHLDVAINALIFISFALILTLAIFRNYIMDNDENADVKNS